MAFKRTVADPERTALSVIDRPASGSLPGASSESRVMRAARKSRERSKRPRRKSKDATSDLANELVVSRERVATLREALAEFRIVLVGLVQASGPPPQKPTFAEAFASSFVIMRISRVFSSSLFGRELSRHELVAEYANLYPILEQPLNLVHAEAAFLGLLALKSNQLPTAQSILEDVKFATSTPVALTYVMRGVMRFVFGAGFIVYLLSFVAISFLSDRNDFNLADSEPAKIVLATVFGSLGGVVSLLMRLAEFETTRGRSRQFLVLSGTTLPIVGGIFAAVIAALLASKVINFGANGNAGLNVWLFVVIGFLAGFSERFTRNILRVAEDQFSRPSGKPDANKAPRKSP